MAKDKKEQKQEIYLSVKDAADRLRALADDLEKGIINISDKTISLSSGSDVKINFKSRGNKLSAKFKFGSIKTSDWQPETSPAAKPQKSKEIDRSPKQVNVRQMPDEPASNGPETYKDLKKRMSQDIKSIMKNCMSQNIIPDHHLMERFYLDSKTMCDYQGRGDVFYKDYLDELEIFYQAFKSGDLKALSSSIASLNSIKKACHDKYK